MPSIPHDACAARKGVTVLHAFEGTFDARRPLRELATVFDMIGFGFETTPDRLRSTQTGLTFDVVRAPTGCVIAGRIDDAWFDPHDVLQRFALALEADGIGFEIRLLNTHGVTQVTYESDR